MVPNIPTHGVFPMVINILAHGVFPMVPNISTHGVFTMVLNIPTRSVSSLWFPIFPIRDLEPSSELLNGENVKTIANKKEDNLFPILESSLPDILTMC
jgi:hypothetical protein